MSIQLKLDDFVFQGLEIPESIAFGGRQLMAVHKLVGGQRIIDVLGRDDDPLEWSGLFQGSNALARAKYLHALRIEGKPHTLTWGSISYTVVIESFRADFERTYVIPYKIVCEVVNDNTSPSLTKPPVDITRAIVEDLTEVQGALKEVWVNAPKEKEKQLAKAVNLIKQIKDFVNATNAQISEIKGAVADLQQAIQDEISAATNQIQALTTLGGLVPGNPVSASAMKLNSTVSAATNAYRLENIGDTLLRLDRNLDAVKSTPNAKVIQVSGTTLYKVAMDQYGDATLWHVIADANRLTDPVITGIVTLTIPPL